MKKSVWLLCLVLLLCGNFALAENWAKSSYYIPEKGWSSGDGYKVNAELVEPPDNRNSCGENETSSDKALKFNVQYLRTVIGPSFDVNNIYVDGISSGEYALNILQAEFAAHGQGFTLPYLWKNNGDGYDWSQYGGYVYVCVGGAARSLVVPDSVFEKIILWYKDPNKTTYRNVSSSDICNASGSNWLQKILGEAQAKLVNTFCNNANNKAKITFDTQANTATITSKVPLNYNGDKSITIPFSQAGVSSAQVKAGIGKGYGGNANGSTNGTGSGYDPDPNGDTWAGYDHHVGLKYMKIGKKSSGHWEGLKVWSVSERPDRRDFRIKLKRKGGVWPNQVCAEVWFSHNKYFTDEDWHLKTKCKDLSGENSDYRSIYVENVYIPNEMEAGKNYYFFTRVTYSGGVNPSSRSTSDEYVKVEIIDFSSEFEVDTVIGEVPLGVFFTNKSKLIKNDGVNESITYHWDFGDGITSNEEDPIHVYENVGTYTVRLTTIASWGETKTSQSKIVTVIEPEDAMSVAQKMEILW